MKPEYVFLAVATIAAVAYYAFWDPWRPDHSEFGADRTTYSIDGIPVDPEDIEPDEDLM